MKVSIKCLSIGVVICLCAISTFANTEWTDMVSPINHSQWADIAIADFNTDGIQDIVAANPDGAEIYSNFSGLPVWSGKIYNGPTGGYYWGLASGNITDGTSTSFPEPDPANQGSAHVACVFNGNSCNIMAEWSLEIVNESDVWEVYSPPTADFIVFKPSGTHWPDSYHLELNYWTFTQVANTDEFTVGSSLFGNQSNRMTLNVPYTSDRGEITVVCQRVSGSTENQVFNMYTRYAEAQVSGLSRSGERVIWNESYGSMIPPAMWFTDEVLLMQVRYDPPENNESFVEGDTYHFHTPMGPQTNEAYIAVKAADFNQDGQVDIIGAGENGIDIFYQSGPAISAVGFISRGGPASGSPVLDVRLGDLFGYVNPSVIYEEFWNVVYEQSTDNWTVYGEILDSTSDPYEGAQLTTNCKEISIFSLSGNNFTNNDKFTFSTKRVNWSPRSGPSSTNSYTDLAIGDIDRNGWLDILGSKSSGGFDIFLFDGVTWNYTSGIPFSGVVTDMLLKDVNSDGWLDVIASSNTGVHYWKGAASGAWSQDLGPVSGRSFFGVAADDFNMDGYVDIAASENLGGSKGSIEIWYLNEDGSWFQNARASIPKKDPDNVGDGFMGIVKVSNSQTITESWVVVCETAQANSGLFKVTGSRSGQQSQYAEVGKTFTSDNSEIQFSLFDGNVDFAVGDSFDFITGRGPLELNVFGELSSADLDNDGNSDLFAVSLENSGVSVWLGNSNYGWTADTPPESSSSWQTINTSRDLNFDGNPDIVVGSYADAGETGAGIKIWTGDQSNEHTWTGWLYKLINNGKFNKISYGDFNIDGALDLVLTSDDIGSDGIWVLTGNNFGEFEKVSTQVTSKHNYFSVLTGDFNNDGYDDIVAGHRTDGFDVFLTNSDLSWSFSTSSVSTGEVFDLDAADIDRDGDLDIVIAENHISSEKPGVIIYYNDGNGGFSESHKTPLLDTLYNHWSVEFVDLDKNGVYDVVATNTSGNPGTQVFYGWLIGGEWMNLYSLAYTSPSGLDHNYGLISADFNLDNRQDFVVGEDGHACLGYIGYSGVASTCAFGNTSLGNGKIRELDSQDLNNDGFPDIVIATEQNGVQAYLTSPGFPGTADFSFTGISPPAGDGDYVGIIVADFTSDGLPDVIASRNQSSGMSSLDMWISQRDFSMAYVTSTYPLNGGEFNVGEDETVYVYFSEPMDPATMTYDSVKVTREGEPVAYSFITTNYNSRLRITINQVERNQEYSVQIMGGLNGVRDSNGNMFDGNNDGQAQPSPVDDYTFSFTAVDHVPPSIPIGLQATGGDAEVKVQWTSNSDPVKDVDLEGYYVIWELADGSEPLYYKFYTTEEVGAIPHVTIRGLTNGVGLLCSLSSRDFDGNESIISTKVDVTPIASKPQIWWGGMYDSFITSAEGGDLTILAYVFDHQGDTESVELYFDDLPTGVLLPDGGHPDFPTGLGLYALNAPVEPFHSGYAQIPFQLVAHDSAGNDSLMWPYYHVMKDVPGGSSKSSGSIPEPGTWSSYFAHKKLEIKRKTSTSFTKSQPSTSPDRPQILCAGYTAHAYADFEWGARHTMTAIILDPNNSGSGHDLAYVDLLMNGIPSGRFQASGLFNEGYIDEIELGPVVWGIDMTWYGEQNDPDGPDGTNHWPEGPQFVEIQAVDRQGNASDIWPNFTIN